MHIAGTGVECPGLGCRNVGVGHAPIRAGSAGLRGKQRVAVPGCLGLAFLTPAPGHGKAGCLAPAQIERDDGVLGNRTPLHEQDVEMFRHRHQFADVRDRAVQDDPKGLPPVAHLHHSHATGAPIRKVPVQHLAGSLPQHGFGQGRGAGGEVVGAQSRGRHGDRKRKSEKRTNGDRSPGEGVLTCVPGYGLRGCRNPRYGHPPRSAWLRPASLPAGRPSAGWRHSTSSPPATP